MSNSTIEINGVKFVPFRTGLKHPKFTWFIMMLNKYGIAHALVSGERHLQGQMLYVQQGNIELCNGILSQELAVFTAKTDNFSEGPSMEIIVSIDDLPNDHDFFEVQLEGKTLISVLADSVQTREEVLVPETPASDEDDEDEDFDWGFQDPYEVPSEDEDEDEEPVPAPTHDEPVEAEPDPVPTKKKKKVAPELAEAAPLDPEMAGAGENPLQQYTPVTGEEFLTVDEVLPFEDVVYPGQKTPTRMYDAESSTLSAVGAKDIKTDPLVVTLYARFKSGGTVYRYAGVPRADYNSLLNEIIRKQNGIQEASGGSFFHHTIKVKAEEGKLPCQRLGDNNEWVVVLPKSERTKAIKERAKS